MNRFAHSLVRAIPTIIVVVAAGHPAFAQTESVHGVVVDDQGRPLRGARVEMRSPESSDPVEEHLTDADGGFSIAADNVRPGYELRVALEGFDDGVVPITAQHMVVAQIHVTMTRTATVDTKAPVEPSAAKPTPVRVQEMTEQQKQSLRLYNDAVEELTENKKNNTEDNTAAEQKLREAASLDPSFAAPHRVLLNRAMEKKNWAEASRYADDLIRIDPNDAEAARSLYVCLVILRHSARVGEAAKRLIETDPSAVVHVENHAREFYRNNLFVMARALYQAITEIAPDSADAFLNLGVCCKALGDVDCTRAAFGTFLELAPEDHPDIETVRKELATLE